MTDDAIPAATLVVWRDAAPGSAGPEILMVERSAGMAFAAGAIVFPGGRIDAADRNLADLLGRPDDAGKITAIRETIEESAVATGLSEIPDPATGAALQLALNSGTGLAQMLADNKLSLDLDRLTPFARWMPGFKHTRKFDTIFYLVRAPEGAWAPIPQPGECVSAEWASPAEFLARIDRGEASAIFPTKRNLERLAGHANFEAAVADACRHSLETIIPWIENIDGEPHVCIPEDRGYPVTSERLTTAVRA